MFIAGLILFAACLAGRRARPERRLADRRARRPGPRRRAALPRRAVDRHRRLFAEGAERNKALGVWGAVAGSGRRRGRPARRRAHRVRGLGVGAVRQRADRPRRRAARAAPAAESRDERATRHFDVAGAVSVTAGLVAARLHAGRRQRRRAGARGQTLGLARRSRSRCSSAFVADRAAHASARWCRSRSSACGRCAASTSSGC